MSNNLIYTQHKLEESDDATFQKYGDLLFYPNGIAKLGAKSFSRHVLIHRHRFGANLVAIRTYDSLNKLTVELPTGELLYFLYRPLLQTWYQLVVLDDPWLYRVQQRFGSAAALSIYYATSGVKGAVLDLLKAAFWSHK